MIDASTKDMRDRGVALSNSANPGFSAQKAGLYGSGAAEARDIARDPARGGVQAYDDALAIQEQARRQNLAPLEQGPLGRIADAKTTQGAYGEILPPNPLTGGEGEIVDAVRRIAQRDPELPGSLVRQSLAGTFDRSAQRLVGGENQYGGARFAKDATGTRQQETNLEAVLGETNRAALPQSANPALNQPSQISELFDVLRATGMRKPQGSATEFNRQIGADLSEANVSGMASGLFRSGGTSLPLAVWDQMQRAWLGRNTNTLADLFTAPDSVARIGGILAQAAERPGGATLVRQLMQTGGEMR